MYQPRLASLRIRVWWRDVKACGTTNTPYRKFSVPRCSWDECKPWLSATPAKRTFARRFFYSHDYCCTAESCQTKTVSSLPATVRSASIDESRLLPLSISLRKKFHFNDFCAGWKFSCFSSYLDFPDDNDFLAPDVECKVFVEIYVQSLFRRERYRLATIMILHTTIDALPIMCINYVVT